MLPQRRFSTGPTADAATMNPFELRAARFRDAFFHRRPDAPSPSPEPAQPMEPSGLAGPRRMHGGPSPMRNPRGMAGGPTLFSLY